jgi:hypothetical protein
LAGNNPREAVQNFFTPLQLVLACFSRSAHLSHLGRFEVQGGPYALLIERVRLPGSDLYLDASMNYKIVEKRDDPDRGPYKVSTTAYQYIILNEDEGDLHIPVAS